MKPAEVLNAKLAALYRARAGVIEYAARGEDPPTWQVRAWFEAVERAGSRPTLRLVK